MRAQTFEMDLLAINDKAFVMSCRHGKRYIGQAMCAAAVCAGKVWMTLSFGASVSKLEMPGAFVYKSLMNKSCFDKTFERSVNRHLVEVSFTRLSGDFFLAEGFFAFEKHL